MRQAPTKNYNSEASDFAVNNLKKLMKKDRLAKVFLEVRKMVYSPRHRKFKYDNEITKGSYLQYVRYFYDFILGVVGT